MIFINGSEIEFTPASHEDPQNPGALKKVLLKKGAIPPGGNIMMLNWAKVPPAKSFALHYHEDMHEVFTFISGAGEMRVGQEVTTIKSGDCIVVPPMTPHKLSNTSVSDDLHYLVFGISHGTNGQTVNLKE